MNSEECALEKSCGRDKMVILKIVGAGKKSTTFVL